MYGDDELRAEAHARIIRMRMCYMTTAEEAFWHDGNVELLVRALDDEAVDGFRVLPNEDIHWYFEGCIKEFFTNRCTFPVRPSTFTE